MMSFVPALAVICNLPDRKKRLDEPTIMTFNESIICCYFSAEALDPGVTMAVSMSGNTEGLLGSGVAPAYGPSPSQNAHRRCSRHSKSPLQSIRASIDNAHLIW